MENEVMDCDLLVVGGGAAGLSAAYKFKSEADRLGLKNKDGEELMVVVLEKGAEIGAHSLSGAVLDPSSLKEMFPKHLDEGFPLDCVVNEDAVMYLGEDFSFKLPITPPPFKNTGKYLVSVGKLNKWLAEKAEAIGVNVFPGFSAVECLYDENNKVIGVKTGDRGLNKEGKPKANFEAGMIINSPLTIFADGTNSPLFKRVEKKLNLLKGKNPKVYELGCKEIIQLPKGKIAPGKVIHTLGYPLTQSIGGTFIYTLQDDKVVVGLVAYLDSRDPLLDVHRELQKLKTQPYLKKLLEGGKVISYGGKTLPAGGYYSMPKLFSSGMMVCGDAASMVDVKKLKGIHLAMKSGMLAAETAIESTQKNDFSETVLANYTEKINNSFVKKQLWKTRNFHQTLSKGLAQSFLHLGLQEVTNGRGLFDNMKIDHKDHETTESSVDVWGPKGLDLTQNQLPAVDNKLYFDKLSSVYLTGTGHDEDSPNHLKLVDGNICTDICAPKFNSPCNHFCPAQVYEMQENEQTGKNELQINYTNCIHCQTCDLKCPFDNIDWTLPEAGGGPNYMEM